LVEASLSSQVYASLSVLKLLIIVWLAWVIFFRISAIYFIGLPVTLSFSGPTHSKSSSHRYFSPQSEAVFHTIYPPIIIKKAITINLLEGRDNS